jgi:16S rRNA G966 N2-methylase RsmD
MKARDVLLLCPAGFERIVSGAAARDLTGYRRIEVSPGYVRCRGSATVKTLAALPYATNAFDVVASVPRSALSRELVGLTRELHIARPPAWSPRPSAFRLRIFDDGRFASTGTAEASRLAAALADWSGLRQDPRGGHLELWVIRRRDARSTVLGTRLGGRRASPARGSLRGEIAAALVRAVPLNGRDTVLDPFAGSGAIGVAALQAGATRVWLNDVSPRSLEMVRAMPAALRGRVHETHHDVGGLVPAPGAPEVTAVVTDPPWGLFAETREPIDDLYARFAAVMATLLAPGRPMVVLTGAPVSVDGALTRARSFEIVDSAGVLVNGKKARVLHLRTLGS